MTTDGILFDERNSRQRILASAAQFGRATIAAAAVGLLSLILAGCGLSVPSDPEHTLSRATGGTLRVGVSVEPGLVEIGEPVEGGATSAVGPLARQVEGFARAIDARIEWSEGSEETLVGKLESREIDMAVGGFSGETPWIDRAGVTREYTSIPGAEGRAVSLLVPLGENAFLSRIEAYFDEELGE